MCVLMFAPGTSSTGVSYAYSLSLYNLMYALSAMASEGCYLVEAYVGKVHALDALLQFF